MVTEPASARQTRKTCVRIAGTLTTPPVCAKGRLSSLRSLGAFSFAGRFLRSTREPVAVYNRDLVVTHRGGLMIRNSSLTVGCWLMLGAILPSAGCGSSEPAPAPVESGAGAASAIAGAAGSTSHVSAGATSSGVAGSPRSAGGSSGASNAGGRTSSAGAPSASSGCDTPGLVWKSANKTNYTSYPEPGSDECVKFSGCEYEGLFEACQKKQTLDWVKAHNIVAAFPLHGLERHDLCLKSADKTIVVHGLRHLRRRRLRRLLHAEQGQQGRADRRRELHRSALGRGGRRDTVGGSRSEHDRDLWRLTFSSSATKRERSS